MNKILLLQQLPGFGTIKVKNFLYYNNIFLDDDDYIKNYIERYTGKHLDFYIDKVKRIENKCASLNVKIVKIDKSTIIDYPLILYIKGDENILSHKKILGVVGTREPSNRGLELGRKFIEFAVNDNWITISGLAKGCDTLCHRVSINCGGKTIAVIPSGYNKNIAPWLLESGIIISEYPPGTNTKKYRCIKRNRIITGLSKGLYVIESQKGGGSEHSIKFAYKGQIPIAYNIGFNGIEVYGAYNIKNCEQFDLYLKKCIK